MDALRRLGLLAILTFVLVNVAYAVIKPPRGGLFGASRQSDDALHAIDRLTGTGERIGDIEGNVAGFIVGALAKEPSTGILYGLGPDPVDIRLVVVDARSGDIDDGSGGDGFIARLDPNLVAGDEFLQFFSGADFGPDGLLYAAIGIFDPATLSIEPYLATVSTAPVEEDGVLFVDVAPIGMLPATMTGISFDADGVLWGVSPLLPFHPTDLGNHLFRFGVNMDGTPDPTSVADFPLLEGMTAPPPGSGFASLQFTCDGPLYAGNLETVTRIIDIEATWEGDCDCDELSGFAIRYEDLDGDLRLDLGSDAVISFTGISELYEEEPESWDELDSVPEIPGITLSSGPNADGDSWWAENAELTGFDLGWWSYAEVIVEVVFHEDGGQIFEIETSPAPIATGAITRVAPLPTPPDPPVSASGGAGLSGFAQATSCGVTSVRNSPTSAGADVTVISIDSFEQEASFVETAGTTSADFCVAPDPREVTKKNGQTQFKQQFLAVADLSFTGTCGDLTVIDLRVPPWYRGYRGVVTIDDEAVEDVWLVVAIVQTDAEYDGPVVVLPFPETLVDYDGFVSPSDQCGMDLEWRPLDLGGAVPALGDFPNTEGDRMIMQTAQCNRPGSMTRRTTHVYPVRLDAKSNDEHINLQWQLNGLESTIAEAFVLCAASPPVELSSMQASLAAARPAIAQGRRNNERFYDAILLLEQIARDAKAADFSACPTSANYRGNLMSRGVSAAFTVFDRLLNTVPWRAYRVPEELEIPILTSRDTSIDPLP